MGSQFRTGGFALFCLAIFLSASSSRADDNPVLSPSHGVRVEFSAGQAQIATLQPGGPYFVNRPTLIQSMPDELKGLSFTKRYTSSTCTVTVDVPAQMVAYLITGSAGPQSDLRDNIESGGAWKKIGTFKLDKPGNAGTLAVFKCESDTAQHISLNATGYYGISVAASAIDLVPNTTSPTLPLSGGATPAGPANAAAGWTWRVDNGTPSAFIKKYQSAIKALYIIDQGNGSRLGVASDLIFTADPGTVGYALQVSFTTPIGLQTKLAVDDVIRHLSVAYPTLGGISRIEFSFEDKYDQHDGGSIGAACGTLLLSAIENFDIDPHIAMTGDISADGKVRPIGGISAKLRGARDAGCSLAAIPSDNVEQLIDAFIYGGNSVVTDVQVLGISDLDEAASVARSDRSAILSRALAQFAEIQKSSKDSPDYLNSFECRNKLKDIVDVAPNHLSARILLNRLQHQQRRRLSATASEYYTFAAVQEMLPTLASHEGAQVQSPDVSNVAIEAGLKSLRHLRPMADLSVQPLIDAWMDFSIALENQNKWTPDVAAKAQAVRDALARLNADQDLAQKMLKEGI